MKIVSNFQQNHRRKTYSNVQKGWKNHGYSCAGWLAESYFLHRSARAPINNWGLPLHTCIAPSFLGQLTQWIILLKNRLRIIHDVGKVEVTQGFRDLSYLLQFFSSFFLVSSLVSVSWKVNAFNLHSMPSGF